MLQCFSSAGVYVPKDHTDAPKHFRGLGIRIEDNILVTKEDPINMTETCPKLVEDIEKAIASHWFRMALNQVKIFI